MMKNLFDTPESERRPLTNREFKLLIDSFHLSDHPAPCPVTEWRMKEPMTENFLPLKIMLGRLRLYPDLKFDEVVCFWVLSFTHNPAEVVMWSWSLVQETKRLGRPVTMRDWAERFTTGVPSNEYVHHLWDEQKGRFEEDQLLSVTSPQDNWLDTKEAWL